MEAIEGRTSVGIEETIESGIAIFKHKKCETVINKNNLNERNLNICTIR